MVKLEGDLLQNDVFANSTLEQREKMRFVNNFYYVPGEKGFDKNL